MRYRKNDYETYFLIFFLWEDTHSGDLVEVTLVLKNGELSPQAKFQNPSTKAENGAGYLHKCTVRNRVKIFRSWNKILSYEVQVVKF